MKATRLFLLCGFLLSSQPLKAPPEVGLLADLITDEFREVISVWKWGVRAEWRESKCSGVDYFSSLPATMSATDLNFDSNRESLSEERCWTLFFLLEIICITAEFRNSPPSGPGPQSPVLQQKLWFRWNWLHRRAFSNWIVTVFSCSWMMPACWTGIYCLLAFLHICSGMSSSLLQISWLEV